MAIAPWNNWYHIVGSTYGTWLRGDPRGWRARHHREHCEGDYKHRPDSATHAAKLSYSLARMRRQRVTLGREARVIACCEIALTLRFHSVELIDLCVGERHYHILARFDALPGRSLPERVPIRGANNASPVSTNRDPRHLVGIAKKQSAKRLV
jgi:hypothetical protein